jgi:arylsulfatase A-like enzyme
MNGRYTRTFENYRHPRIRPEDFRGDAAILDNRYKLLVVGEPPATELYDVREDPGEKVNLIAREPALAKRMEQQLRDWQRSVLTSLTGADYASD